MRKDYEYVYKATSLCFTTTKAGDKWLEDIVNGEDFVKMTKMDPVVEVLSILQSEYVLVEKGKLATVESLKESLRKTFRAYGNYKPKPIEQCVEEAVKLWGSGSIGVKLVIWD